MILWGLEKGLLSWADKGVSEVLYKALLDGLPMEWCAGNYDNDEMVIAGRAALVSKGIAPSTVRDIARNIGSTGNPFALKSKSTKALVEEAGGFLKGSPEVVLHFGSWARVKRPQVAVALIRIMRNLGIPFEVLDDEVDSGFLLYQLGDFPSASEQARRVSAQLRGCKARKLVTLSASAYRMFTTRYLRFGEGLPEGMVPVHATSFISELLEAGRLRRSHKLEKKVTYHDPSCLARYTYVTESPRILLMSIAGPNYVEMEWANSKAHSAGETGGLFFLYPETAEMIAAERVKEAVATGAKILCSSDCACEEMFSLALGTHEMEIKDIVELILDAM
jgi:Fe-S oxidoreductase